ncbi:hypothetical protein [Isoptericola sp. b408]|uniref:hypothetical protein n=1 Tax=Isoptericola sp. b408 TaxID=3064653 RepID=UPI0027142AE7|nr:hypothetical protein [Isoptericola sp. b408]MDO8150015.1 hypothetical protein [Isoptericola sp. b408]
MPSEIVIARESLPSDVRQACRAGEIERIRRGAYRSVPDAPDGGRRSAARDLQIDRARALDRQLRAGHWFSHATAAMLHGLPLWRLPSGIHVLQAYRASSRAAQDVHRHVTPVPPGERTEALGLPSTTLERTVADCATTMSPLEGLVIADSALVRGLDRSATRALIGARTRGRRRGLLVLELADRGAESPWESWLRYVAHWAGLPRPRTQVPVTTRLGRFRVDIGWPEHAVLAEFDGLVKYRTGALGGDHDPDRARIEEKRRADAIAEATGIQLLRVTSKDAHDPQAVADRLLARFPAAVRGTARRNPLLSRPR